MLRLVSWLLRKPEKLNRLEKGKTLIKTAKNLQIFRMLLKSLFNSTLVSVHSALRVWATY